MKKTSPDPLALLAPSPSSFAKLAPPVSAAGLFVSFFSGAPISTSLPASGLTGTGRTTDSVRPERMNDRASAASKSDSGELSDKARCRCEG